MAQGIIHRATRKGFGWIQETGAQQEYFFCRSDLDPALNGDWGERIRCRRVTFDVEDHPRGPRARNVRSA